MKNNVLLSLTLLVISSLVLVGCTSPPPANNGVPLDGNTVATPNGGIVVVSDVAQSGDTVQVHYTGKLTTGEQFDSSVGKSPLSFTIDDGRMIKGFNEGVKGMKVNEKKTITLLPKDAYGEFDPSLVIEVDRNKLQGDVQVGMTVRAGSQGGPTGIGTITEIRDSTVVINFNHELAGKTLVFDLTLVQLTKKQ